MNHNDAVDLLSEYRSTLRRMEWGDAKSFGDADMLEAKILAAITNAGSHETILTHLYEALEALESLTFQHCYDPDDAKALDSMGLSDNANAMRVLNKHGRIKITFDQGRRVLAVKCEPSNEIKSLREEALARRWLGEILAVIHRDGGHYLYEHGTEKATRDAIEIYYQQRRQK